MPDIINGLSKGSSEVAKVAPGSAAPTKPQVMAQVSFLQDVSLLFRCVVLAHAFYIFAAVGGSLSFYSKNSIIIK